MGDPEKTHEQTLALLSKMSALDGVLEKIFSVSDERLHVRLGYLTLPNPVGLAGGFDKNAVAVRTIAGLGFGVMEIGAIMALGQPGNAKPRQDRLPTDDEPINRLRISND